MHEEKNQLSHHYITMLASYLTLNNQSTTEVIRVKHTQSTKVISGQNTPSQPQKSYVGKTHPVNHESYIWAKHTQSTMKDIWAKHTQSTMKVICGQNTPSQP